MSGNATLSTVMSSPMTNSVSAVAPIAHQRALSLVTTAMANL